MGYTNLQDSCLDAFVGQESWREVEFEFPAFPAWGLDRPLPRGSSTANLCSAPKGHRIPGALMINGGCTSTTSGQRFRRQKLSQASGFEFRHLTW